MTTEWSIHRADEPSRLVANSHLFDRPVTQEGAASFLSRPGHVLLLALSADGRGIGFVSGVEMQHPDKSPEMFVYELGVDDGWRRRGIATALLTALGAEARRRGCAGMWTGTEKDNVAALATYERIGAVIDEASVFITWEELPAE
ncbi:N-acetyltransferase [Microbacterium sp. G2-8]|uniref:GNAT family N-acetyltransferase n=1 Tax=Microbacterium sp. G2-8 TaxID=2842454 RepID=UPI001C8A1484|nr:GNAT family N-acetyltransferase [Microbacterium sp. G2-8]